MRRMLTTHQINDANTKLRIAVTDEPGAGGACNRYCIFGFDNRKNPSAFGDDPGSFLPVVFQNGPIKEVGVNGVTHEVLLAILIDRLQHFQAGKYACSENLVALESCQQALNALNARSAKRQARGVEGTHEV